MDGWYAYDYQAGRGHPGEPDLNVFHSASIRGSEVSVDDTLWSIDEPESPRSVLALVRYDEWSVRDGEVDTAKSAGDDLRGSCVSFDLLGRDLDLRGADVTFWVFSSTVGQRWRVVTPLSLSEAGWTHNEILVDEVVWRRSWAWDEQMPPHQVDVLRTANSYGIAFVGFTGEPTGALRMRDFEIGC